MVGVTGWLDQHAIRRRKPLFDVNIVNNGSFVVIRQFNGTQLLTKHDSGYTWQNDKISKPDDLSFSKTFGDGKMSLSHTCF